MEQADLGAPARERRLQGGDRQMAVVHGADGPPHDESREQIQDRREVELAAAADDELGRVADPPLIRRVRLKPTVQQIGRDGLVVITHGRVLEALAEPRHQPVFLHQSHNAFAADVLVLLDQILVDTRAAVAVLALASNETRTSTFSRRSSRACVDSGRCCQA